MMEDRETKEREDPMKHRFPSANILLILLFFVIFLSYMPKAFFDLPLYAQQVLHSKSKTESEKRPGKENLLELHEDQMKAGEGKEGSWLKRRQSKKPTMNKTKNLKFAYKQAKAQAKTREAEQNLTGPEKEGQGLPINVLPGPSKLTIEDCVNIAIENYPPLKTADKQIKLAKLKVKEAWRKLMPSLSLKWDEVEGTEFTGSDYMSRKYGVEAKQPLFHGGELLHVLQQAKVNLKIAQENKRRIKNELTQSVKKAFYSLVRAKEILEQQENLLNEVERIFNSVKSQYQQDLCSELELLDVESKYNEVYFQFISSNEDLKLAELILKQAMNIEGRQPVDIGYSLEFENALEIDLDSCLELALVNRPGLKINELVTEFTKYGKKIASAKGLPRVDITGSFGQGSEVYKEESFDMNNEWYVGTKVSIPFGGSTAQYSVTKEKNAPYLATYQGTESIQHSYRINLLDDLKIFSTKKEADIDYEQAKHELDDKKEKVILEVEEAFFAYEKALIQIDAAKSKMDFQYREVEIFRLKRSYGELTDSQVIDSLIKLTQEQFSRVQAITGYYIAITDLNKAIGIDDHFELNVNQ